MERQLKGNVFATALKVVRSIGDIVFELMLRMQCAQNIHILGYSLITVYYSLIWLWLH